MKQLLYVNACLRPPGDSRTARLAQVYLDAYRQAHQGYRVEELNLREMALLPVTPEEAAQKDRFVEHGELGHPSLRLARQFAAAEDILVAAPCWNLTFPAQLKIYFDYICVIGVTFRYTEQGQQGLCRAKRLRYLTTMGDPRCGLDVWDAYLQGLCHMLGIGAYEALCVPGLDGPQVDVVALMEDGMTAARAFAER
jgi:FMN-dependent NADH-azoreductase